MLLLKHFPLLAVGLSLSAGCIVSKADPDPSVDPDNKDVLPRSGDREHPSEPGSSWTFLVYMVADNDLEPFGVEDLIEMSSVGSTDSFNIVVQADRSVQHSDAQVPGLGDWTSTKRLVVRAGEVEEVEDLGELNMGESSSLADFIEWGVTSYPADRYALVFWDHGAGWTGFGGDESTPNGDSMNLAEIDAGMEQGMTAANLDQFSLIGFDACLMATYEVAYLMSAYGEYLLASEELEPGHGWNYERLATIANDPSTGPVEVGTSLMDGFMEFAQQSNTSQNLTLSLVDLYGLEKLALALDDLAEIMDTDLNAEVANIAKQRYGVTRFGDVPDPSRSSHMVDLGDFVWLLAEGDASFESAREKIEAGLDEALVAQVTGPMREYATGLSIYFPELSDYYQDGYDDTLGVPSWRDFLASYYELANSGEMTVPLFANANQEAEVEAGDSAITLTGTIDDGVEFVSSAVISYGIYDEASDDILLLGRQPAAVSGDTVTGSWDYSHLAVNQGGSASLVYTDVEMISDSAISVTIPFWYRDTDGQEDYAFQVYIIDESGNVLQSVLYSISAAGVGQLQPKPGSAMVPIGQVIDAQGAIAWAPLSEDTFDPSSPFAFSSEYVDLGATLYAEIGVTDFAGNYDYAYALGEF
jgi:hypothetical protein